METHANRSNRITLRLTGAEEDIGHVRFNTFLKQLEAVQDALNETDRIVSQGRSVYYRVVSLDHRSPASVQLEAVPLNGSIEAPMVVLDTFYDTVARIQFASEAPEDFDYEALQKYKKMVGFLDRGIVEAIISRNGDEVQLSKDLSRNVDLILGPDEYEMGSVSGMLHHVNLHGNQKVFTVYPIAGRPKLKCIFTEDKRDQVTKAVDHYVSVFGRLKYKMRDTHPYEMTHVRSIEVYPDESELPTLGELFGISPDITGEKSSEEFVRDLRLEW